MKLLQINSVVNYGSTGHIAEDIGKKAIEKGWESYILYGRYPRHSSSKLIRIGNDFSVKFHGLISRLFDKHGLGSFFVTKKIIKKIKNIKPDIIHLHNIHGYYLNCKVLFEYLKESDIPVLWTLHDCWSMTGHCSHFCAINCNKWLDGCYKCTQSRQYPKSFIDNSKKNYAWKKTVFTNVKNLSIITPSKWLSEIVKQSYLKDYPVNVINNGINLDVFNPCKKKANDFVILGVASVWDDRKGLSDFIELSKLISHDEKIILVGLTKAQIEALPHNIIGIQRTESQKALAELYSEACVFVNPTYEDTFPTTNLEAMACGTPVVTYSGTGSGESVEEGCGFVVPSGNVSELYKAILQIKNNGVETYKKKCSEVAKSKYDKDACFEEYFQAYAKLKGNGQ